MSTSTRLSKICFDYYKLEVDGRNTSSNDKGVVDIIVSGELYTYNDETSGTCEINLMVHKNSQLISSGTLDGFEEFEADDETKNGPLFTWLAFWKYCAHLADNDPKWLTSCPCVKDFDKTYQRTATLLFDGHEMAKVVVYPQ